MQRILTKDLGNHISEKVNLRGWVDARRDHGKLIFIDLRDRSGIAQAVFTPKNTDIFKIAENLRDEWVISIDGMVKKRPEGMINKEVVTGFIEIAVSSLEILNKSKELPFGISSDGYEISDELRLEYRYLDLRRKRLSENIRFRSKVIAKIRDLLYQNDFVEIETPALTKSTPEGARDFIVPSRLHRGKFYALPQSPQQYKELLMTSGFERYFQIARNFRDEDSRGDRQPEHTQLDLETSFMGKNEVISFLEDIMISLVKETCPYKKISEIPFPRISYRESMEKYGNDKPDLRKNKNDHDELAFAWITDFPSFEKDNSTGKLTYTHNPFTAPQEIYINDLFKGKNLDKILSEQYDLALNGHEIGSGSERIHTADLLFKVFEILGHRKEEIIKNFGHMLNAFEYGTPPHAGMAWGLDRLIMILRGEPNIREVMAFPKTGDARDPMMDTPSEIPDDHLKELGIRIFIDKQS